MTKTDAFARVPELEARATADHKAVAGRMFSVTEINGYGGYPDSPDDSDYFKLDNPIVVRVRQKPTKDDLLRWQDEWLDPIWEVDVISGLPENLAGMYKRFTWIDGIHSYNRLTGECVEYGHRMGLNPVGTLARLFLRASAFFKPALAVKS